MISSGPLEDRIAIRELIESYNQAVMHFDADHWASNWAPECVWSLPGRGDVEGREHVLAMWKAAMSGVTVEGFFASAGVITVTGDTAHGTWYQQEFLRSDDGVTRFIIGEYDDDYVKTDGRWFFAKRIYGIRSMRELH
jgi:uncharacterized protein (TIGR02246 family)